MAEVKYKIHDVEEVEFSVKDGSLEDLDKLVVNFNVKLGWNIEQNIFAIILLVTYEYDQTNFLTSHSRFLFLIEGMQTHVKIVDKGHPIEIDHTFLAHLIGISIGMLRGIIYTKTKSLPINKSFLPFVNMAPIIDNFVKNKTISKLKTDKQK